MKEETTMDVSEFLKFGDTDEVFDDFYFCPRCNEMDI